MTLETTILLVHLLATVFITGLVWFVQVVHYPLFAAVGEEGFVAYERAHVERTGWVVAPAMLVEAAAAIWLALEADALAVVGLALLGVVWGSTWGMQVPLHHRLSRGFDADAARRLVHTNWIRTLAWSGRSAIAAAMLLQGASS